MTRYKSTLAKVDCNT